MAIQKTLRMRCKAHENWPGKIHIQSMVNWFSLLFFSSFQSERKKQNEIRQFLSFVSIGLHFFSSSFASLIFSRFFLLLSDIFGSIINHHVFLPYKSKKEKKRMSAWIVFEWIPTVDGHKIKIEIRNTQTRETRRNRKKRNTKRAEQIRNKSLGFCSVY